MLFSIDYSYYETYKILIFDCIKNKYINSNNKKINNKASLTVKVKDALVLLEYSFHFDRYWLIIACKSLLSTVGNKTLNKERDIKFDTGTKKN